MDMDNDMANSAVPATSETDRASTRQVAILVALAWVTLYGIKRGFSSLVPGK